MTKQELIEKWKDKRAAYCCYTTVCGALRYDGLAEAARDILKDLELLNETPAIQTEWISIKDRLPEKHQRVLINIPFHGDMRIVYVAEFLKKDSCWYNGWNKIEKATVTHWMPLPAPPEAIYD